MDTISTPMLILLFVAFGAGVLAADLARHTVPTVVIQTQPPSDNISTAFALLLFIVAALILIAALLPSH